MSEATQRLSDEIKSTRPDIDWEHIGAFRNILVHNYLGIDLELIWTIIDRDMPVLKQAIDQIIQNQSNTENFASEQ